MAKVYGLTLDRLTDAGERTYIARWSFSKTHVSNYTVQFQYYAKTSRRLKKSNGKYYDEYVWLTGSSTTVTSKYATYTVPEEATRVRVTVKPNSTKTKKVRRKKTYWWTGKYSSYVSCYVGAHYTPDPPSVPTISIEDNVVTVTCENLDDSADKVRFEVVKDDSSSWTKEIQVSFGKATYTWSGSSGSKYRVRAQSYNTVTLSGKEYKYWSDYSDYSSNAETRPLPPTDLSVSVKSRTSVKLTWTKATTAKSYEIHFATNKEELEIESGSSYRTQSTGENVSTYILPDLDIGETWYFRLRSVGSNDIKSTYTSIVNVVLGTKPEAPTTWSSANTAYIGEIVNLYWVHNSEDGSDQVKANIEVSVDGRVVINAVQNNTKDEYGEYSTETSVYKLDTSTFDDSSELLWRIRTMGVTNEYGEWSIQRSIKVYEKPSLLINVLDGENGRQTDVVDRFPLYINLSTSPSTQIPIGYSISVISTETYSEVDETGKIAQINTGDEIYNTYMDGNDSSDDLLMTLLPSDIDLQNGITYKVIGTASFDSGLTANCPDTDIDPVTFIVAMEDEVYDINASIEYNDDDLTTYISPYCTPTEASGLEFLVDHRGNYLCDRSGNFLIGIFNPEDNTSDDENEIESEIIDYATGVTMSVYRREANGKFVNIATNIANDGTVVTDPHPSLDYARYRIIAISDSTGAVSYEDVSAIVGETSIVIQWGEEWMDFSADDDNDVTPSWSGSMVKLPYNIDVTESNSMDVSLVEYIGRSRPVSYYGTQLGENPSWSCEIPKEDTETLYQLRRLMVYPGDVYVREPSGTGYWAQINVSFNQKHNSLTVPITLNIKPVEGGV